MSPETSEPPRSPPPPALRICPRPRPGSSHHLPILRTCVCVCAGGGGWTGWKGWKGKGKGVVLCSGQLRLAATKNCRATHNVITHANGRPLPFPASLAPKPAKFPARPGPTAPASPAKAALFRACGDPQKPVSNVPQTHCIQLHVHGKPPPLLETIGSPTHFIFPRLSREWRLNNLP